MGNQLNFFPIITGGSGFVSNTAIDVILTRDSSTNTVSGYLNGSAAIAFVDGGSLGVFSTANDIMQFFKDDFATGGGESSGGFADYIRVFDGALSGTQAECVGRGNSVALCDIPSTGGGNNVPEPGTLALLGAAVLAAGLRRRK